MTNSKAKYHFDKKVKAGDYLAEYFKRTSIILQKNKPHDLVTMQWFTRAPKSVLAGINQTLALLKFSSPNYDKLKIWALKDGDHIKANEPVLKIEGHYYDFAFLEGVIDGILARNTSVATSAYELVKVAHKKPIIAMNDRADLYLNQQTDGYACYIGGIRYFVTQAAIAYLPQSKATQVIGTMPHALIQAYKGDTLAATIAFHQTFPQVPLVSLVDYHNDCVHEAVKVANYFGEKLWAVRLDTSNGLVDKYLEEHRAKYPPSADLHGVNPYLVRAVRQALDETGHQSVKIIVSSGFNVQKISEFEAQKTPVDIYGVGAALSKNKIEFTGDLVLLNGHDEAKVGRHNHLSSRLRKIIN